MTDVFVLVQSRIWRSVCDIQSQDDISEVVGVYGSFSAAKAALRKALAGGNLSGGDESFYFGMWRGHSLPKTDGWPVLEDWLEDADEESIKNFKHDHAALLAGEPGAEDRFKLSDGRCSYMGYSTDGSGKVVDNVIDMEDDMLPFKWNESWYPDGGTVSIYWEDTSFATEGMEAITLKISKKTVQA